MTTRDVMTAAERYGEPQLQRREFVTRAAAAESKREVTGLAVPWGQEVEIFPGFFEQWERGAAESPEDGTKLFWLHTHPIGRVTAEDADHADGWDITARISRTPQGDEALTLTEDEVVTRMSVGFRATEWTERVDDDGHVHVTITRAVVPEVSLVPFPAYSGAKVTGTRSQQDTTPNRPQEVTMPDTRTNPDNLVTTEQLEQLGTELREGLTDVRQSVATLPEAFGGTRADDDTAQALALAGEFRSIGDYAAALANDNDDRHERAADLFTRAVTTDDTITSKGTGWVGDIIKIINRRRRILNLFGHTYTLPAKGMTVEYGYLKSNTIDVAEQVNQGDNLVYGEVKLGQANAPVKTFGGYTEVPRQVIERSDVGYLDFVFEAFAAAYGRAMELYARSVLNAGYAAQVAVAGDAGVTAAGAAMGAMTDLDWINLVLDADEQLDEAGHAISGLLVSKQVLRSMAAIEAKDRMLRWSPAGPGEKAAGTLYVRRGGPNAEFVGINVDVNPAWSGTEQAMFYDELAMKTREAPGAPFRLQDEKIVNLTKQFSVYGYASSWVQAQNALLPVKWAV